ncbi:MAG: hypothetical protein GZ085_08725 [Sulfuriferula multivorans]|uniref:Exonuclease domain-containing protein n=1 Tax=Sulfuriferula multivorans TaxID=1559896 RepID=A0A7C9K9W2_9PROT|nr:hypothetical protein [Sulfuriferula multivorans]
MINRALKTFLGIKLEQAWADLAYIAPALHLRIARRTRALDDWMKVFGISNYARHNALADALATAELFLVLQPLLASHGAINFRDATSLERAWKRQSQPV